MISITRLASLDESCNATTKIVLESLEKLPKDNVDVHGVPIYVCISQYMYK